MAEEVYALYRCENGTELHIQDPLEVPETVYLEDGSAEYDFVKFVDENGNRVDPTEGEA